MLARQGESLLLVASDRRDLEALAAHLRLVYLVKVGIVAISTDDIPTCAKEVQNAALEFGEIGGLFFPIGASSADDQGLTELKKAGDILRSNLEVVIALTSVFLPKMLMQKSANIVGFGSIASIRGRNMNVVYSAAKRGLESYFESLRYITANSNVRIQFYKLGYVDTQQSFGQRLLFPVVTPQAVAYKVVGNLGCDLGGRFYPRYWGAIALAMALTPWHLYKKVRF
jgi:short-subunit dehydrogenase